MAGKQCVLWASLVFVVVRWSAEAQGAAVIPFAQLTALDGHTVALPRDLPATATVLIVGFGPHSQEATTAWEKPVRSQLAQPGTIGFFDIAMLAEVPAFARGWVLRAVRHAVPDILKPNFLPIMQDEPAWKAVAGYAADQPDAAYVLLVDRNGRLQWSTHAAYTDPGFAELSQRARTLAQAVH